jgi:hypothetical protein
MSLDRYDWKDRQRARRDRQQAFSWLGLVIALLVLVCVLLLVLDHPTEHYDNRATADAVRVCVREGRVAYVNRLRDEVSCEGVL